MTGRRATSVVEIIGPAGSGKTTLATELATWPGVLTVSSIGPAETRSRRLLAAGRAMPVVLRLVRRRTTRRQIAWAARLGALDSLVRRADGEVLVLDQGPVYTLSRLLAARPELAGGEWAERRIENWALLLDAVVVLDAPDGELAARIHSRQKDHAVKAAPDAEAIAAVRTQRAELGAMVTAVAALGVRVLDLRTDHFPVDQIAAKVMGAMRPDIVSTPANSMESS